MAPFSFIDLFAGIGGIRLGFEAIGGRCVWTSEWNKFAQQTYISRFGNEHAVEGDITKVAAADIPRHNVLLAGFPCQPFSIAGVSKKNALGRAHGFACDTQGTLFFDVARIIEHHRPEAILLENVKNLKSHDKGNTFKIIQRTLEDELGYEMHYRVIDAKHFVPQHRERIFMVGFRDKTSFDFQALKLRDLASGPKMREILHECRNDPAMPPYTEGEGKVAAKYTLTPRLWEYLQAYAAKHKAAGNGFGFGLVGPDDTARTLSARYHKDGSEILVSQGPGMRPRRLTPRECARLMGYPDEFPIPVSDTQAYRQFGNSVVVPVVEAIARHMEPHLQGLLKPARKSRKSKADAVAA
ncbi:DNA (cytosine-5-)-methyltransferase [Pseudazoarcus pumilus]|uniref:Cytosine-specific methyltransferase n=1 Tax=Pseudazoarcus pumilus TaxID=2067960 RepID=A0A2I6S9C0_9RHOO|nr:DNA (cytosine-5-)-methyltransferase [Pseudazoarcus pumilus]AUN95860.1 DNA (cytosine-5-)-methyltransferase [Pseudazoarcus pumilus]